RPPHDNGPTFLGGPRHGGDHVRIVDRRSRPGLHRNDQAATQLVQQAHAVISRRDAPASRYASSNAPTAGSYFGSTTRTFRDPASTISRISCAKGALETIPPTNATLRAAPAAIASRTRISSWLAPHCSRFWTSCHSMTTVANAAIRSRESSPP